MLRSWNSYLYMPSEEGEGDWVCGLNECHPCDRRFTFAPFLQRSKAEFAVCGTHSGKTRQFCLCL